ncbi:ABC transporter substrate-binding protein [Georgenia sp. Z1491]|uniref:ABC transporter substrate-binding protein n=1 Tax=Georgenia sp. Z1491 TaxID=3416707 RepID=UPI003CE701FF
MVVAMGASLTLAACGSEDGEGAEASTEEGLVPVAIAETPGMPTHIVEFGIEQGFFEDAGLDATVTSIAGGSQQVTAAMAGEVQFTGGDVVSINTFLAQDMPLVVVGPGTAASEEPEDDFSVVVVRDDSPIQEPEDLEGASLATNELDNITALGVVGALDNLRLDTEALEFVEIPFPEMVAGVENGHVDAATLIEPFATIAISQGYRPVLHPFASWEPETQIGISLTTQEYASENPEVVEAFQAARLATAQYVTENPDEFRSALLELGEFDEQVVQDMNLPLYREELDRESIERAAALMVDHGILDEVPDYEGHIDDGA